jgi:hypothetical protein
MAEEIATAHLVENEFIELTFLRESITLDVNEVIEGWEKAKQLSPDKKAMVLLKTGKWTLLEKEARDYVIHELQTWPAVAIVIDNMGQRIMGHVVINVTGKGNQIKLFENEIKAKAWLKGKLSKNS